MSKLNLREASLEDAESRVGELREEFISLDEGRRSDPDAKDYDAAFRSITDEADNLDTFITLSAAKMHAEKAKVAATMGALHGANGLRSVGDALVDPDYLAAVGRGAGEGGTSVSMVLDGQARHGTRSLISERTFEGEDYKKVGNWLRLAGMYGDRAVTEWGASGPGAAGTGFDPSDSGGLVPRLSQPIPPVPRQAKLYLRDLMGSMPTQYPQVPYVRELNPAAYEQAISGGATTVAEGSVKPTAQLSFVSEIAPVATIAATLTLSKQMFQDGPAVVSYLNGRMPYLVKLAEDAQFLSGNGTWPNITGITNTAGILSSSGGTSGDYAVQLGNAFAKIENQDGVVDAVVFNPIDAWTMFTKRAAGGSGTFDAGTPFSSLPLTVWGVQTYRSRVYPQGSALVSDFQRGAMVIDRESVNVQTYNERYAEQNLVLVICEERVGLAVFRPDLFCQVTFS